MKTMMGEVFTSKKAGGASLRVHSVVSSALLDQSPLKENAMGTPASFKNHPLHPILVAIPIGLWTFAFVCDLIHAFGGKPLWAAVALYCVAGAPLGRSWPRCRD
jgi:hypothetical protein